MEEEIFWKDGDYEAQGGIFVRNELGPFFKILIEKGIEPVGIKVNPESRNLEIIIKKQTENGSERIIEN